MTLDASLIRGSRGESYINEFVWKSYQDGTLLVIHAPEMNDGPVEGRNKLEVLLRYKGPFGGDFANPYRVVRLPLEKLQEPDYGVIDAFSPWGPRKLYTDTVTGLMYFGKDLRGLSGMQLGRLEFPEGGAVNGDSQIISKPAFIGNGQGSSEELVLSGSGMVFKSEGVGNLQAA